MKNIIQDNKWFLYPFFCYLFLGFIVLCVLKKGDEIWFLNQLHAPIGDMIMKYLTDLGDGLFAAFIILSLLWIRYDYFLVGLVAFGVNALVVQFLKRIIFSDMVRPLKYFGEQAGLHLVEGVTVHQNFSFPSGHANTVFMVFCLVSLASNTKKIGLLYFLVALVVSFTRPYLVQHFFIDIYVGALIAVTITLLLWNSLLQHRSIAQNPRWQKSLRKK